MAQQDLADKQATSAAPKDTGTSSTLSPGSAHGANQDATKTSASFGSDTSAKRRKHGWCYRIFKWVTLSTLALLFVLGGALYYFLGTLNGARQGLDIANNFIPDFIIIDTTIKSGSILEGLELGETLVDIKDIVAINADSLTLQYDLWQLKDGLFKVSTLEATNLGVSLYDKLFESDPNAIEEPRDPNEPPFRLSFPVDIDIDDFHVATFNFNSQIVDVQLNDLRSALWAHQDNIGTKDTLVETVNVHLKSFQDVENEEQQALAAAQTDKDLALVVDGKTIDLKDVNASVAALVQAAQLGQSVEMVLVDRHNQEQALQTEQELFSSLKPQYYDQHSKQDPSSARVVKDSLSLVRPGLVYSDPELYADAMESALLNKKPVPAFVNIRPMITDPHVSSVSYHASVNKKNSDDFESSLLDKLALSSIGISSSYALQEDPRWLSYHEDKLHHIGTSASNYEHISNQRASVDGVSSATAAAIAQEAKLKEDDKARALADKSAAMIKEFGSGDGAIETLPKIILPFNIEAENFVAKKVRYYQEGFDTRQADISFNASWYDTNLKIYDINVEHEFGKLMAIGDLDFNNYFDLNFVLEGEGYKNDQTHEFMQGLLYGLNGDFKVSGNLTDLKLKSTLNLGGTSILDVHANVLSGALPISVSLKTRDITYPIFGKPLVNAKSIDLHTSGNLIDGIDVSFDANVSGFEFTNVISSVRAQISYEKSHVELLEIAGSYNKQPLQASVKGDFFYGKVIGADARVFARVKDAGFISPMLKGELNLDGDFVAILNQKELAKSAVSIASEPVYLANRIPKTSALIEDFDADTIEKRLLEQVKSGNNSALLSASARLEGKYAQASPSARAAREGAPVLAGQGELKREAIDPMVAASADNAEEQLLSGAKGVESSVHIVSKKAVAAVNSGQTLAAVRPIHKPHLLEDGVPDGPYDMLISQQEYLDAVRFVDDSSVTNANGEQENFLKTIFSEDLPEIMTNIRYIKGDLFINGYQAKLKINDVVGDIHQGFRVDLIKFTQADNIVLAEGQVTGRGADLNLVIDLKDLSTLVPSLEGSVSAYMASSGNLSDLNFDLSGSAPLISSGDMRIRKLVFNSSFNMQTRSINFTALADRIRWAKGMAPSRNCFVDLSGTPLRHNLSANCSGMAAAYINIDGSADFAKKTYSSNLLELYLQAESTGSLSLLNPVYAQIDYGNLSGQITPLELRGDLGSLKISKTNFSSSDISSHVTLREFNLNSLKDFFPDSLRMQVPLNVDANILVKKGHPDIKLLVQSDKGVVYSTVGAGFAYDNFTLSSHLTKDLMHSVLDIDLRNDKGNIDSVIDIKDPTGKGLLSGYFKIDQFDLQTISNIGQSFTELKGFTNVDAKLGGTLSAPAVTGLISTKGSAVPRYDVGQVNEFDLQLNLLGQQGDLDGRIVLNGGELKLGGTLDWSQGANGTLTAQAKELPIFLMGYGVAQANIDSTVTLGEVMDIKGDISIPKASISVASVASSGVIVSPDEIVVPTQGTQALMAKAPSNFKSSMDVKVGLGNNVRFSAMGMVKGHLEGGIHITKQVSQEMPKANGEVRVSNGNMDVYGHKFNFSQARINFFDDITDPNLNIEVVADKDYIEDDVTVGARVVGTAQNPEIKLFSKPTMSENEILSYILYGHGLEKNALNQDSNNSNLLLGLGVSGLSGIASAIVGSFGVQDVQLGTQGSGDEMQVEVQGYINRRLRLSYGYGVFSSVGEFKIRYELFRNLYAEFVSSLDKAVDIVYSFEFD